MRLQDIAKALTSHKASTKKGEQAMYLFSQLRKEDQEAVIELCQEIRRQQREAIDHVERIQ